MEYIMGCSYASRLMISIGRSIFFFWLYLKVVYDAKWRNWTTYSVILPLFATTSPVVRFYQR